MPQGLFMEVLMCHLGHKNKESCHCSTGAARVAASQCSAESAEAKCAVRRAAAALRLTRRPLTTVEMERQPAEINGAT